MKSPSQSCHIPRNELFQLDAMACMLIDSYKTGFSLPNAQKARLFGNKYYWNALEFPEEIPSPILKRFHLSYLFSILDDNMHENSIETLNNSYRVFKSIDYPPELEYSDEFLSLLVDYKTQLFIANMIISTKDFDKMLKQFVQNLQVYVSDDAKAKIINNKWLVKCSKRMKDIARIVSVQQLKQEFPLSEFLDKIKSFLIITADFWNQKFPAAKVRDIMNGKVNDMDGDLPQNSKENKRESSAKILPSDFKTNSSSKVHSTPKKALNEPDVLEKENSVGSSRMSLGITKPKNSPLGIEINQKEKVDGINATTEPLERDEEKGWIDIESLKLKFKNLKSCSLIDIEYLHSLEEDLLREDFRTVIDLITEKVIVLNAGYSELRQYISSLKDFQREIENKQRRNEFSTNELPWTDDEEGTNPSIDKESDVNSSVISDQYQEYSFKDAVPEGEGTDIKQQLSNTNVREEIQDIPMTESASPASINVENVTKIPQKRSRRSSPILKNDNSKIQKAQYKTTNVFEICCNNSFVLRRRSDGWVNANSICDASNIKIKVGDLLSMARVDRCEQLVGKKYGRLAGLWVPVKTAEAIAFRVGILDELKPLFSEELFLK